MIKNIIKKNIVLIVSILTITSINAQSKFGEDENSCKENLSMFREYYKQKNYADALNPWRWAYNNCPASSGNIYKNGPKIIKERIKEDQTNKDAYIDTLMMIFDQRIQYGFGEEGYILGLKGYELVIADKNRSAEAFEILKKGVSLVGNNSDFRTVYGYMKAVVNLEKSGAKTKSDVLSVYAIISEIIDYNIVNESKITKYFIQYSEKIENLFAIYANCDDLITLFTSKFDSNTKNIDFLKRVTKVLDNKKCTDSELFFNASSRQYDLEPSAASADQMSKMSIAKGKSSDAISYAKEAIEMEEDSSRKAKYYLALADAYRSAGSFTYARNAVYSALEFRNDWGEAYMNLGNIYIAGASSCGNDFEQKTVYWVAVDAFKKALHHEDTKARASKSINIYSKYFPTTEICFFNGVDSGKSYMVSCWINKSTTARTSD
ncbi:hypothetical protein OAJ65_00055 [Flavobacteriales bacterium]|nr:hypothetical protein [Flavobacteriales bacterium]